MCVCVCVHCHTWILLSMLGLKMYIPALILLETKTCGFSTKRWILPLSDSNTTTPYLEGSSTRVTYTHTQQPMNVGFIQHSFIQHLVCSSVLYIH